MCIHFGEYSSLLRWSQERYLKNRVVFTWVSQLMANRNGAGAILPDRQSQPGGIDVLDYNSRISYGCKLLGYSKEQG